jgi:hypothetical protein
LQIGTGFVTRAGGIVRDHGGVSDTNDLPVEVFLDDFAPPIRRIADDLRAAVLDAVPDAVERVRPGWRIVGFDAPAPRRLRYFAWVFPERVHCHLGFPQGVLMADPEGRLEGRGITKNARWLTFVPGDRVDAAAVRPLILEGLRVASLSRDERFAAAMAREEAAGAR